MQGLTRWEPSSGTNRWDPFREFEEMHSRLASLFGRPLRRGDGEENITAAEWAPLVDITEDDKEYLITAELPQVNKNDVKVTLENGILQIQGERKIEKDEKGRKYHRVEQAYGSFVRSFSMPDDADASKINAEFRDGLLRVHIAKSEHAKPRTVEVKVA